VKVNQRTVKLELKTEVPGGDVSPSKHLRRDERFDRLQHSLDRLSPDHRRVIILSRIKGLTTGEIAIRMDRSESAVKSLLFRALRELKGAFGDTASLSLPDRSLEDRGSTRDGH
jgi:RNA polymerase sigma-70 factor (ECF subfamily)